eukprot:9241355-Karenia_brevis.AAC.1
MKFEDALSRLQEGFVSHRRPKPRFQCGQSVLHFWAGWMPGCEKAPLQVRKKDRPKWYSAQLHSLPVWKVGFSNTLSAQIFW